MKELYKELETVATRILKELTSGDSLVDPAAAESILQIIKFAKNNIKALETPAKPTTPFANTKRGKL